MYSQCNCHNEMYMGPSMQIFVFSPYLSAKRVLRLEYCHTPPTYNPRIHIIGRPPPTCPNILICPNFLLCPVLIFSRGMSKSYTIFGNKTYIYVKNKLIAFQLGVNQLFPISSDSCITLNQLCAPKAEFQHLMEKS